MIGWFIPKQPQHFTPDNFPVWIVQDGALGHYYGAASVPCALSGSDST